MRILAACLLATTLACAPALAAPETHGTEHGAGDGHGHDAPAHGDKGHAEAGHGDHGEAGHGDAHEGGHGDHYLYTADADGDGTVNWLDSTDGDAENTHYPLKAIAFHAVNLIILIGILFWFGRRPIGDALASRALNIRKELAESARLRDEAEQRNTELTARLNRIESEIQGMHDTAVEEAAAEEAKLIERAKAEGERIKAIAERSIRDEVTRARASLRADAVKLAVELAEGTLKQRVDATTQQRLAKDFLESIKQGGVNRV